MIIQAKEKIFSNTYIRYFFTKKITIFRWQLNLFTVICILLGIVIGSIGIIPRIIALGETQFTIQNGGNTDFTAGTPVSVTATASEISLSKDTNWYSLNWNYKKILTIKNTSSATLNANSSISIKIDTSTLESVLANCNDLRVIYQTNTELPLTISREPGSTNCNDSKATMLNFPIQASLTTGASDSTNYALYYGNTGASSQGTNGYSIPGGPTASMVCSFKSSSTCETGQTPTTETGAIRYSGTKSGMSFDGNNDYISIDNQSFQLTGPIEIEAWINISGPNKTNEWNTILGRGGWASSIWLHVNNNRTIGANLQNKISYNNFATVNTIQYNTWNHIVLSYDPNGNTDNAKIFINGVLSKTYSTTGEITDGVSNITLGGLSTQYSLNGKIDELRISNIVRYTSNFTPPTAPFVTDANTKLLYHFDENGDDPRNTGKVIDASVNGNHGTITGAIYASGLVGVNNDGNDTGKLSNQTYASHSGVFIEEGTTNLITNPSFEHGTYNTNWSTNYMNYGSSTPTFTPNMAKRNSAGPFAAGPMVQGKYLGGETANSADNIYYNRGTQINGNFYSDFDTNQGSLVMWVTPEWNGNDNQIRNLYGDASGSFLLLIQGNILRLYTGSNGTYVDGPSTSAWTAGSTYNIVVSWDVKNSIDGSNKVRFTVNGANTYSTHVNFTNIGTPGSNINIGSTSNRSPEVIYEGVTVYRRVLYDGTYGTNVGNGNEISLIYNSGTGKDPTLITGSWDVVFALPTNASTGTITTGIGDAWSHAHSSSLLYTSTTNTGGFMMNGTYGTDGWVDIGSPTSVVSLATAEKIFNGGYKYTSTGANQGIYRSFTATNGGDYVLRALGNSDGTCNPQVKITRADGTTEISHLNGTTTSTKGSPDVYIFTWESPAAESEQVQLINIASSGTCYWHQVEVLNNLIDNPSMERGSGDPWIPGGSSNGGLLAGEGIQDTIDLHSGSSSFKLASNQTGMQGISQDLYGRVVEDKFYDTGLFGKKISGTPSAGFGGNSRLIRQTTYPTPFNNSITNLNWTLYPGVIRRDDSPPNTHTDLTQINCPNGVTCSSNVDDFYVTALDDITLTVTPANQTNSTESSGLRVDGADTLTQTVSNITSTNGIIRFKYTPRHSYSTSGNYGINYQIVNLYGDATNNIALLYQNGTILRLTAKFNGTSVTADYGTPNIVAGTLYIIEISYSSGGNLILKLNNTQVASAAIASNLSFSITPTTAYFGSDQAGSAGTGQCDCTITNFATLGATQNTTSPYMKFGSNSVRVQSTSSISVDEYTTSLNVGNTSSYTLSAYVYDATTGNLGGIVSNTIAELYFNNTAISTTYTDMGGGWWRLTGSLTGVNQSALYGVQVKQQKTIYIDGVQLEAKTYPTSYADGSLGTGYSWSGTANNSNSTRSVETIQYNGSNLSTTDGTFSFWIKPNQTWDITYLNQTKHILSISSSNIVTLSAVPNPRISMFGGLHVHSVPSSGSWRLVTVTYSPTSRCIYSNQTQIGCVGGASISVGTINLGQVSATFSDLRVFNQALSANQVSDLYYQGLAIHSEGNLDQRKYSSSGTWESPIINLGNAAQWGASTNFDTSETLNGNSVSYQTKTSIDGNTWSSYASVTGSGGGYDIQSTPNKYIQVKATLNSAAQITTPSVSSMVINYVQDNTPPITNGLNSSMKVNSLGRSVPEQGWTNDLSPYFQWDIGEDDIGGSGLKGYCLSLSQTIGNDPATSKGLLGTSPLSTTGSTCQFIVGTNSISFDNVALRGNTWLTTSADPYYFSIKAIDNTGNVFAGSSETFEFKFDDIPPTNVTSFSAPQNSFANVADIYFNWPTNGNGIASDSTSGLLGYQFAISNETTWLGSSAEATLDLDYIPLNYSQPFNLDPQRDGPYIQIGNNSIYLRAIDQAGNRSTISRTALVSYGGDAPSFTNGSVLTITPTTNTSNMYSVSWPAATAANGRTVTKYYYMINTTPPATLSTMLNNSSIYIETTNLSIPNGPLTGAIKGSNTIYVVAIDDLNNYSPSNALSASFTLDSSLPDPVKNLSISDASVKSASLWRVSLAWEEPDYKGTGVLTYKIQRSTNNSTWSDVSTTTGNAYVDTVSESKRYYWRVGSMDTTNDSINNPSYALSVTFIPKGSFTSEAPLVSGPTTSNITTRKATVSWITSRTADSRISYGLKSGEYFTDEIANSNQVTEHTNTLTNLLPSTTYYYKAKWVDEDGNLGQSNEMSFTTSPAPIAKDVVIKSVGINFAQITFTTVGSTKAKIYYGKTSLFGGVTEIATSTSESTYTVIFDSLDDGTKYYFRVNPFDIENTEYEGTVLDFKTYPRPKVFSVNMQQIRNTAETSIQVSWQSNTEVSSIVTYYPEGKIEQSRDQVSLALVSGEHKMTIIGLLPDTKYNLIVKGIDRVGNEAKSEIQTFTTATDTRAPKISEVLVETYPGEVDNGSGKKSSQIIVSWKTDEPATSRVEYGEGNTDVYEFKTPIDDNLKLNHVVIINNLDISKIYHLRAISLDKAKNESKSQDVVTITAKTQDNAFDLIFKNIRNIFNF